MADIKIEVLSNGPLLVTGPIDLVDDQGNPVPIPAGRTAIALCRGSVNKPFCGGQHSKIGFKGSDCGGGGE